MRELLLKLVRKAAGQYSIYRIYRRSMDAPGWADAAAGSGLRIGTVELDVVERASDPLMAEQARYIGPESHGYGCFDGDRIVGLCFYWFGDRYRRRGFWPLRAAEGKLVQIVVLPQMRGRGVASRLIALSCEDMFRRGFSCLYARVWHSNAPSLRAFERAGWTCVATIVELNPLRLKTGWQLRLPGRAARTASR